MWGDSDNNGEGVRECKIGRQQGRWQVRWQYGEREGDGNTERGRETAEMAD